MLALRDREKVGGEVVESLGRPGIAAHLKQGVAIILARALDRHRQLSFLPLLGEDQR
jgi:hypothetical protein